ncbi:nitroreductase [Microbacterium lacus]|uniref:nitroreductase n=1 Tax=Microbacterium lacus TaxID=415217 RepID=UPI003850EF63
MEADAVNRIVAGRRSKRAFRPGPVPHAILQQIFDIARASPSWCNSQPWHAYVTQGDETDRFRSALLADALAHAGEVESDIPMPTEYRGHHLERRRESGWQLYDAVGVARGDREASARQSAKNFELFGAPHVAIVTVDVALGPYAILDVGIFVGHLLLAAASLGVGTIPQAAVATRSPLVRSFFGIPETESVLVAVSLGWPDDDHPANGYRTSRAESESVVRWRG